ncbi:hypothetical protein V1952_06290 [Yersinia sp. 2542 StPb PI]
MMLSDHVSDKKNLHYLVDIIAQYVRYSLAYALVSLNSIDGKGMGYYVCPMRRLHRCNTPSIRRDIADVNLITTVVIHADKFQTNSTSRGSTRSLQDRNIEVLKSIYKLIEALQIAPEVTALAEKIKALHKEFKSNEATIRAVKYKQRLAVSEDVTKLDLTLKDDRSLIG